MDAYHITAVNLDDIKELQEIGTSTFREAFEAENTKTIFENYLSKSFSLESLKKQINNPKSQFYFLREGIRIIGYLKVNVESAQTEQKLNNALEVERIYLLEKHRGKGIGNILMDKAIEIAKKMKKTIVWLGVWEENPSSIKFYQKYGFKIFDKHNFMMADEVQVDFLMKLELD